MKVGIGYLFGAKDDGLKGTLKSIKTGLTDVDQSAGRAEKTGGALRDTMLGLANVKLGQISDQIERMGSSLESAAGTGPSGGLESRFAQERAEFDKTFRQIAVTSGIMGDDLEKLEGRAFSMAKGLNRDMETIGKALVDFKRRGLTPEDVGLDTFEDLIKVSEVSGLAVDQLAVEVKGLQKSYNGTQEEVGQFLDRFTAVAQKAGIADEALKGLPGILRVIDDEFAKSVGAETVKDVEDVALSIVKLSSGFEELGVAPGDAIESAKGLFKTLFSESEATDKMMAGLQDNFGDLANELTLVDGRGFTDVMKTLEDLKHDPAAFAMELQKVNSQLAESGNEVFQKRFAETIGGMDTNLKFLIESGLNLGEIFGELQKEVPKAGGAFKKLGEEGFRTGRTLEDRMQLAKDSLEDAFLSIGRPQVVKMVERQEKAYSKLGKTLKGLGERTDFLGKIARGISAFAAGGILAVLFGNADEIPQWAIGLEAVFDMGMEGLAMLAPLIGALGAVGVSLATIGPLAISAVTGLAGFFGTIATGAVSTLSALFIPALITIAAAVTTAVAGFYLFKKALDGALGPSAQGAAGALENLLTPIMDFGTGILGKITTFFDGLDPKILIDSFMGYIGSALGMAADAIPESQLDGAATGATDRLLEAFISAVGSIQGFGQRFFTEVSGRLAKAYDDAGGWQGILGFMVGKASGIGSMMVANLKAVDYAGIMNEVVGYFTTALTKAGEMRSRVSAWFRGLIEGIDMGEVFRSLLGMRDVALGFITQYLDTAAEKINSVDWAGLGEKIGTTVMEFLFGAAEDDLKTNKAIGKQLLDYFGTALKAMGTREFWAPIGKALVSGLKFLWAQRMAVVSFFTGLFAGIGKVIVDALFGPQTGQKIIDGFYKVGEIARTIFDGLKSGFEVVSGAVKSVISLFMGGGEGGGGMSLLDAFTTLLGIFTDLKTIAGGLFDGFLDVAGEVLGELPDKFATAFETIRDTVETIIDGIVSFFSKAWSKVTSNLGAVGSIVGTLADKFGLTGSEVVSAPEPTLPPPPEGSLAQKKLLAQDDAKILVQTLQTEFGKQNEILNSINRGIASIKVGGGGGVASPEPPNNAEVVN